MRVYRRGNSRISSSGRFGSGGGGGGGGEADEAAKEEGEEALESPGTFAGMGGRGGGGLSYAGGRSIARKWSSESSVNRTAPRLNVPARTTEAAPSPSGVLSSLSLSAWMATCAA